MFGGYEARRTTFHMPRASNSPARIILLGIPKVDVFIKEHHLVCSNANLNKEDAYEEDCTIS